MSKFIIEVRTRGFGKAEQELKQASSQTRKFARESNNARDAGAVFRKEVSQLRNNMLLYTFAIGGTIAALGKFVMAASNAREQQSKFNVVFGEFAPEAQKFAKGISESFGIAESEMVRLLAGLQDTFVPLGFSRKEASKLSQSIAQLALDVGSFNDIATGDVARRFTSAIVGNHEAVRELAINMTEASLKAKAQQLGLIQLGAEMTTTAKILARLQILYDDTTDAQGDLIKTQDEFANKLRAVQGQFRTLTEQIGETLMPAAEFSLKLATIAADGDRAAIVLGGVATAFTVYGGSVAFATIQQIRFNKAVGANAYIALGTTFLLAVDLAADAIENFANKTVSASYDVESLDELVQSYADSNLQLKGGLEELAKAEKAAAEAREKAIAETEASETALRVRLAVMQESTELMKFAARREAEGKNEITATEFALLTQIDALIAKNKATKEAIKQAKEQADADADANKRLIDRKNKLAEAETRLAIVQAKSIENNDLQVKKMTIVDNTVKQLADALGGPDGLGFQYSDLKDKIGNSTEALSLQMFDVEIMTDVQRELAQTIIDTANAQLLLAGKTNEASKSIEFNASAAANAINSMTSAIRVLKDESADPDQKLKNLIQLLGSLAAQFGGPKGQLAGAALNLGAEFALGHTGGLIRNNGIQRFATGGMVQGQDNVPIMAQAGEFIMRRDAVQNIGVENLAQMNRTGSAGGVTINIQGNMIGNDEFVRDNLVPQLKQITSQDLA